MSRVAIICVLVVFLGLAQADEKYTDKFDNVDVDAILGNARLFGTYVKCLGDDGDSDCTADGKQLKAKLAEALTTDCAKCSDTQEENLGKVMRFVFKNHPELYEKMEKKFDPSGSFLKKHPEYKE